MLASLKEILHLLVNPLIFILVHRTCQIVVCLDRSPERCILVSCRRHKFQHAFRVGHLKQIFARRIGNITNRFSFDEFGFLCRLRKTTICQLRIRLELGDVDTFLAERLVA